MAKLEKKLTSAQRQIDNCIHDDGDKLKYDPVFILKGNKIVYKDRWSKTCYKCDHKEYKYM